MTQLIFGIVATICAILLAYTLTPAVRVLAFKIGAVDVPLDGRRIHTKPIPRIGGLAIYLSFTLTTLLFCDVSRELVTILIGGGVLVIIGVLDDIFRLNAWLKLIIQLAVSVFAVHLVCLEVTVIVFRNSRMGTAHKRLKRVKKRVARQIVELVVGIASCVIASRARALKRYANDVTRTRV